MNNIDIISYRATSTDHTTGYVSDIEAVYYVPFFDYLLIYTAFSFTVVITWLVFIMINNKKSNMELTQAILLLIALPVVSIFFLICIDFMLSIGDPK